MNIFLMADGSAGGKVARLIEKHEFVYKGLAAPRTSANKAMIARAEARGVAVLEAEVVSDAKFAGWVKDNEIDIILSIHTSHKVHADVIEAARVGAYNLHPGRLPGYAGRNPVSWAIFNGETLHASTLHVMTKDIDAGPVFCESFVEVDQNETALTLMAKTSIAGVNMVDRFLAVIMRNQGIKVRPQHLGGKYYSAKATPMPGAIDWQRAASDIERFVRASNFGPFDAPWELPLAKMAGKEIRLLAVAVGDETNGVEPGTVIDRGKVLIAASDRWVEVIEMQQH